MSVVTQKAFVVLWRDLKRWVVPTQSILSTLPQGWSLIRIEELVTQVRDRVLVEPTNEYSMVGVRWYGEGAFHRETVKGEGLSAKYVTPTIPQAIIYNRLFAWKASFAVVPQELEGHFVSSEFPQFIVNNELLIPEYLYLFLMLERTIRAVKASSIGSSAVSRNRFKEEEFLDLQIPLPPLSVQRAILAKWRQAKEEIKTAYIRVEQCKVNIEARFFHDLGLEFPEITKRPKAFAALWNDFRRWSVSYNQAAQCGADITQGHYPVVALDSILKVVQYGTSNKANSTGDGIPVIRMNNIVEGALDLSKLKHVKLTEKERDSLLLKDGDILFNRTNSKELVGKCAVFHGEEEYVFASYLIRVKVDTGQANPDFVAYAINSRMGRQQIDALSRQIIGQANVNSEELRELSIPLPLPDIQDKIMGRVEEGQLEIARERAIAEQKAREVKDEIEALILGTKSIEDSELAA